MHLKENKMYAGNPMYRQLLYSDVKWMLTISIASAFYDKIGLSDQLVANSTEQYCQIAADLVTNSEKSYNVRIKILEAVDDKQSYDASLNTNSCEPDGICPHDALNFLYKVGLPWAIIRQESTIPNSSIKKKRKKRKRHYEDDDDLNRGGIIHNE
jgi:hypothetical protein